jgi:hypothetical protein
MKALLARPWSIVSAQIDLKYATIKLIDGTTPTANELSIVVGEGNLTYSEKKNIVYTLDRGNLDEIKEGDQVPMEVSFSLTWEYIKGASSGAPSAEDALKNTGPAAGWASSDSDACRPYAVDIELTYAPVPSTCGDKEVILFPDFRYESLDHDLRAGTISCAGKCNALAPTITRSAQT